MHHSLPALMWAGKMKSILLADDNPYILDTLAARLRNNSTAVITATNGQEAVDAGTCNPPDLAILDVSMPVMSGLEAAERLHKNLPRLPIILYTSYADLLKPRMHELGVVAVFDKSSSLRELLNTVDECLDRKAA